MNRRHPAFFPGDRRSRARLGGCSAERLIPKERPSLNVGTVDLYRGFERIKFPLSCFVQDLEPFRSIA
jgi:hypothetical protein